MTLVFKRRPLGTTEFYVTGPLTGPLLVPLVSREYGIFIQFKPGSAFQIFGRPIWLLRDRRTPVDSLWGRDARVLERCLRVSSAPTELLIATLLERMGSSMGDGLIDEAVGRIFGAHGQVAVTELSREMDISTRELSRRFHKWVGLSPKMLARIARFRTVLDATECSRQSWVSTALDGGFCDQAHMIRDFKRFSGLTPTAYYADRWP